MAANRLGIVVPALFSHGWRSDMDEQWGFPGRGRGGAARVVLPLTLGAACLALLPAGVAEAGAQQSGPRPAASQGQGAAHEAKSVNASSLPKLSPSGVIQMLPVPHPRGSLSEREYSAAKAAARRSGADPPGSLAPPPANPPLPAPQRP